MSGPRPALPEAMAREGEWPQWPLLPLARVDGEELDGVAVHRALQDEVWPEMEGRAVVALLNVFQTSPETLRSCEFQVFDDWDAAAEVWRVD